ncbi:hypothetical protein EMGBS4_12250 [Acidimicrobiaceae bacterium]|nr:hypothetical protein EMGBS4_12250 [Acidimicrobiaceae bacterium]
MSRRSKFLSLAAILVALIFVGIFGLITDRRDHVNRLQETVDQVFLEAAAIRAKSANIDLAGDPNLSLLAPSTLTSADLVSAIRREAEILTLGVVEAKASSESISNEAALAALNIDPTTLSELFTVVTAVVEVTGDVPRLLKLLDKTRDARIIGPLIGVSSVKFSFAGNQTVATLELVGIRFNEQQIAIAPETTLP